MGASKAQVASILLFLVVIVSSAVLIGLYVHSKNEEEADATTKKASSSFENSSSTTEAFETTTTTQTTMTSSATDDQISLITEILPPIAPPPIAPPPIAPPPIAPPPIEPPPIAPPPISINNGSTSTNQSTCNHPSWIGDGSCDDTTNNLVCNFDGGDCCLTPINDLYCWICICQEDGTRHSSATTPSTGCESLAWKGDGQCDDANNVESCDFDGGDCCGPDRNTDFCDVCLCHLDNTMPIPASSASVSMSDCTNPFWNGDGFCDDTNNVAPCGYDGGDCCLEYILTTYCTSCICHLDGLVHTTTPSGLVNSSLINILPPLVLQG